MQSLLLRFSFFKLAQLSWLCKSTEFLQCAPDLPDLQAKPRTVWDANLVSYVSRKFCGYLLLNKLTHDLEFFHLHKWPWCFFALIVQYNLIIFLTSSLVFTRTVRAWWTGEWFKSKWAVPHLITWFLCAFNGAPWQGDDLLHFGRLWWINANRVQLCANPC